MKLRVQVGRLQSFVGIFFSETIYFNQIFSIVTSFRKLLPKNLLLTTSLGLSNALKAMLWEKGKGKGNHTPQTYKKQSKQTKRTATKKKSTKNQSHTMNHDSISNSSKKSFQLWVETKNAKYQPSAKLKKNIQII